MQQSIVLRFVEGSSSKTYQVQLVEVGDGWVVNYQYGRIGSTLTPGTKTEEPLAYEKALKVYNALVRRQMGKGYTEDPSGVPYVGTANPQRRTDAAAMLLNEISHQEAERLIYDPEWCAEIKFDGERRQIDYLGPETTPTGINKLGLTVPLAAQIADAVLSGEIGCDGLTRLDGEDMGTTFVLFDILSLGGRDLRSLPYAERIVYRDRVAVACPGLRVAKTAYTAEEKRAMYDHAIAVKHEGVVFKRLASPYVAGRPASGGDALKRKFYERASVRVIAPNTNRRSVSMELLDPISGLWTFVGNVTIPPNKDGPQAGEIVDVDYLYAYPNGGSLYQPIYVRPRTDVEVSDCIIGQLKFKRDDDGDNGQLSPQA